MAAVCQLSLFDTVPVVIHRLEARRVRSQPARVCVGRFLHLGAGVQSSTLAEMIVEGELAPVDAVVFADTKDEPPWVYEQLDYLEGRLATRGIPLERVARSAQGLVHDAIHGAGRFASMPLYTQDPHTGKTGILRRQCTSEYKIEPSDDWVRNWLVAHGHARLIHDKRGWTRRQVSRQVCTEHLYGISLDEFYRSGKRGPGWQRAVYPLIDRRMRRSDCERWLRERGLRVPYKSSCVHCPFHDDTYWRRLKTDYPAYFERACQFDDWLRSPEGRRRFTRKLRQDVFLHRSGIPLREVDFEAPGAGPLFELCGDYCMT
jgi:hypothetical protein